MSTLKKCDSCGVTVAGDGPAPAGWWVLWQQPAGDDEPAVLAETCSLQCARDMLAFTDLTSGLGSP